MLLLQFAACKEELVHLLHSFVESLGPRIATHAVDIKVFIHLCVLLAVCQRLHWLQGVCVSLFLRDKAARVRTATFAPLTGVSHLSLPWAAA